MKWYLILLIIFYGNISRAEAMQELPSQSYKKLEFELDIDSSFRCIEKFHVGVDGHKILNKLPNPSINYYPESKFFLRKLDHRIDNTLVTQEGWSRPKDYCHSSLDNYSDFMYPEQPQLHRCYLFRDDEDTLKNNMNGQIATCVESYQGKKVHHISCMIDFQKSITFIPNGEFYLTKRPIMRDYFKESKKEGNQTIIISGGKCKKY